MAEVCVALLLHFITLPCGADIFWKLCENHFTHQDWKVRFQAGELGWMGILLVIVNSLDVFSFNLSQCQCCGIDKGLSWS